MRRALPTGLAFAALMTALVAASLLTGVAEKTSLELVIASRFPRTAAALLTGASLAIAGTIMQMLVRNRFVEPATAGTGQSAALGIVVMTLLWPGAGLLPTMGVAALAALAGTGGFILLIRSLPVTQPLLVPLVGLVYGAVIGAAATYLAYQADLLQYMEIWLNGEFSGVVRGRYELLWISGAAALAAYFAADQFTIAGLGRDTALSLGLNYAQVVAFGLVTVAVVTAATLVTVGVLPFVGLVVPNIVARLMGDNLRATLPFVALMGAVLVLACDLVGRLVIHPFEIPAGTIFGVLGTAVFLWLLFVPRGNRTLGAQEAHA